MRLARRKRTEIVEGDLTPMIDMTFQLIAFFMVLINFSEVEQDQRVTLPASELAQPPDEPYKEPITIQLTEDETILFKGLPLDFEQFETALRQEVALLRLYGPERLAEATVVIRADRSVRAGKVQDVIKACQEQQLETFALRGRQSDETTLRE